MLVLCWLSYMVGTEDLSIWLRSSDQGGTSSKGIAPPLPLFPLCCSPLLRFLRRESSGGPNSNLVGQVPLHNPGAPSKWLMGWPQPILLGAIGWVFE